MRTIYLSDAMKGKYGSDIVYKLVTGVKERMSSLEEILKEIEDLYRREILKVQLLDTEDHSSQVYRAMRDQGLKMLKEFFEEIVNPFRGETINIKVDVEGLKYLRNVVKLNYGENAYKLLDSLINKLFF